MSVLNFAMRSRFSFHRQIEDEILGMMLYLTIQNLVLVKKYSFICDTYDINDTRDRVGEK